MKPTYVTRYMGLLSNILLHLISVGTTKVPVRALSHFASNGTLRSESCTKSRDIPVYCMSSAVWRAYGPHNIATRPSHSVDSPGPQAKMTSIEFWIPRHNAPLAIRYPPDIRPRPLPGLIFSNIRPRSVTNWISTCGLNRFATCSLRSAECHRVKPTANLVCVINEVTGAQLVTAAQHTLQRVGSL